MAIVTVKSSVSLKTVVSVSPAGESAGEAAREAAGEFGVKHAEKQRERIHINKHIGFKNFIEKSLELHLFRGGLPPRCEAQTFY
jgi:hypothetical protein